MRDGWRPFCVDMFGDMDLLACVEQVGGWFHHIQGFPEVPELLAQMPHDIPLVISGGLENHPYVLSELAQRRCLSGPSIQAISQVRNPAIVSRIMQATELRVPTTRSAPSVQSFAVNDRSIPQHGIPETQWLKKRRDSSGGIGIERVTPAELQAGLTVTSGMYFQQFVTGTALSATFYSTTRHGARHTRLLGTTLQLSGRPELGATEFQHCGNVGPLRISEFIHRRLEHGAQEIATATALNGVFGIDLIANDDGLWVLEINPRLTGSHELHEWARPFSDSHLTLQLAAGRRVEINQGRAGRAIEVDKTTGPNTIYGRLIVYSERDFRISTAESQHLLKRHVSLVSARSRSPVVSVADIPQPESELLRGEPVCSVYFDLGAEVESSLGQLEAELRFAGVYSLRRLAKKLVSQAQSPWLDTEIEI